MKIAIVGAGAMGSLFGARLAEAGCDVTLADVDAGHVAAMERDGLVFNDHGDIRKVAVRATTEIVDAGEHDLLVLFCKFPHTRAAMAGFGAMLAPDGVVWTIQNGIGNVDIIADFVERRRILKGLTSVTAIIERPGAVATHFDGASETFAWPAAGDAPAAMPRIIATLTAAGLPAFADPEIDYRIWRKLAVNCSLTVLSAAANVGIGPVGESDAGQRLLQAIVAEVAAVARAGGVALSAEDAWAYVEELRGKAHAHIGSTTVDLQNRRASEIDAMSGAVVREGARLGVATPVNAAIADFVRLIEATRAHRLNPPI